MTTPTPQVQAVPDTLPATHRLVGIQNQIISLMEQKESLQELIEIMREIGDDTKQVEPRKQELIRTLRILKRYRAREATLVAEINGMSAPAEDATP